MLDKETNKLLEDICNEEAEDLEWEIIWGPEEEDYKVYTLEEFNKKMQQTIGLAKRK